MVFGEEGNGGSSVSVSFRLVRTIGESKETRKLEGPNLVMTGLFSG